MDPSKHECRDDKELALRKGKETYWKQSIERETILNPRNGFIHDDTVIIEASLKVYVQSTSMLRCSSFSSLTC